MRQGSRLRSFLRPANEGDDADQKNFGYPQRNHRRLRVRRSCYFEFFRTLLVCSERVACAVY